ncbi:MAG: diguanylate cyclase, partial [Halioglobus sp.]|nr:diguanylate cyclase [Halioglobus sp.]
DIATAIQDVNVTGTELVDEIARPMQHLGDEFAVSATIGIAMFPEHTASAGSLRQLADAAMYEAKRAGKSRYQFFDAQSVA